MLQKARGSYAPYRIWNRTGYPLFIWSDTEGQGNIRETNSKQIANGKTIDWRFDDWRTMREVSLQHIHLPVLLRCRLIHSPNAISMCHRADATASAYRLLVNSGSIFAACQSTGKESTRSLFDREPKNTHTASCAK